jgi:predicted DNA-binding antitoxin AbrB/MazE fold protein
MTQILEAVYEDGVFRPLQVPNLQEGQTVHLVVSPASDSAARVRRFRGILKPPDSQFSVVEELIQERREAAVRE